MDALNCKISGLVFPPVAQDVAVVLVRRKWVFEKSCDKLLGASPLVCPAN